MSKQNEVLKLALEAIHDLEGEINGYRSSDFPIPEKAKAFLRQAIAEARKQEPYGYLKLNTGKFFNEVEGLNPMTDKRYLPLYTKQEPAETSQATYNKICLGLAEAGCRLSEQQKMAFASLVQDTTPPQRKPLTRDQCENVFAEADKLMDADDNLSWRIAILKSTEAAHGIKE